MTAHPNPTSRLFAVPPQPASDLGPHQLDWCRQHIPSFATAKMQADAALAHAAKVAAEMGEKG